MGVADAPDILGLRIVSLFGAPEKADSGDEVQNALPIIDPDTGEETPWGCVIRDTWTNRRAERGECFRDLAP